MTTNTAQDKIRQLCDTLTREALDPAQNQAAKILEQARSQAETLLQEARREAEQIKEITHRQLQQERGLFDSSLRQAASQAKQMLRNEIEEKLFKNPLGILLAESLQDPVALTRLIRGLIDAIERDGLATDLSIEVSKQMNVRELNELLGQRVLEKLREKTCFMSNIAGGVKVRMMDQGLTIDVSDRFLQEVFERNLRGEFVKTFFQSP